MIKIRKSSERGHFDHGWLDTYHTFSFADYDDPAYRGFRVLRVINEDRVAPGAGFPMHSHRDMEIVTYVFEGALEHEDSLGHRSVIRPGEVQRMSAGTGVTHSEYNPSEKEATHLIQIWILPKTENLPAGYEQKRLETSKPNAWTLVASPEGREDSLHIHQDIELRSSILNLGKSISYPFRVGRYGWLQVLRGRIRLNSFTLEVGDGAAIHGENGITLEGLKEDSEVLLFDLP